MSVIWIHHPAKLKAERRCAHPWHDRLSTCVAPCPPARLSFPHSSDRMPRVCLPLPPPLCMVFCDGQSCSASCTAEKLRRTVARATGRATTQAVTAAAWTAAMAAPMAPVRPTAMQMEARTRTRTRICTQAQARMRALAVRRRWMRCWRGWRGPAWRATWSRTTSFRWGLWGGCFKAAKWSGGTRGE